MPSGASIGSTDSLVKKAVDFFVHVINGPSIFEEKKGILMRDCFTAEEMSFQHNQIQCFLSFFFKF